jgi:hypothetical protein
MEIKMKQFYCGRAFLGLLLFTVLSVCDIFPQNIMIGDFEQYPGTDSLKKQWKAFGYSTLDYALVVDSVNAPIGYRYFQYVYSGNAQTTWGGAVENFSLATAPLDLSSTVGIQFYLKGDGTGNKIYISFSNGTSMWSSNSIMLADTNWHIVKVPFAVDAQNGFTNGTKTLADMKTDLANVTDFRIYIDKPVIDNTPYKICFDAVYAMKKFPPENSFAIDDFENYRTRGELTSKWAFFGYSTIDYAVIKNPAAAPSGFKYLDYLYKAGSTTTWGGAFRTASFSADLSSYASGIELYFKGDGTNNHLYLRLDNGNEMWTSYFIPTKDTNWQYLKINFCADSIAGFRYVGNNPDNGPVFSSNIGTNEQLRNHLKKLTGMRMVLDKPNKDDILYHLYFDGIYAVNQYSDGSVVPVELTSFSASKTANSVKLDWSTATETNNKGFEIQKSEAASTESWKTIGFVKGKGTSSEKSFYTYTDNNALLSGAQVYYRLKQTDYDGSYTYSQVVNVSAATVTSFSLEQNYPNPFNPATVIKYQTPRQGFVSLKVYNTLGKEVANLTEGIQQAGNHEVVFNASQLSSGVYFYQLRADGFTSVRKMLLLK